MRRKCEQGPGKELRKMSENALSQLQSAPQVSHAATHHASTLTGQIIAEMEVTPNDSSLMSLGLFTKEEQPRGFSVEYSDTALTDGVEAEVASREVSGGFLYFLQVANSTNRAFCAEVRVF